MHIGIIGAGFSGLSLAWHLLEKHPHIQVTIYDKVGIGGGASGVAAGLLHPFVGADAKLNWRAYEGIQATSRLLDIASEEIGSNVYSQGPLFRAATNDKQRASFANAIVMHKEIQPFVFNQVEGILIENAYVVDCMHYLQGLWQACEKRGARFVRQKVERLSEMTVDLTVIAAGNESASFEQTVSLKLQQMKGQLIKINWPKGLDPLPFPILGGAYIIPDINPKFAWIGATYERQFLHLGPDLEFAKNDLLPKAAFIVPELIDAEIIDCQAGVRAITPERRPRIQEIDKQTWLMTGFSSKGLLYHALISKELVASLGL